MYEVCEYVCMFFCRFDAMEELWNAMEVWKSLKEKCQSYFLDGIHDIMGFEIVVPWERGKLM